MATTQPAFAWHPPSAARVTLDIEERAALQRRHLARRYALDAYLAQLRTIDAEYAAERDAARARCQAAEEAPAPGFPWYSAGPTAGAAPSNP